MKYSFKSKGQGLTLLILFLAVSTGFSQNTLDYYLKAARENNPVIKENLAFTEKAGIQQDIVKAEYRKPKVYATGEINYYC